MKMERIRVLPILFVFVLQLYHLSEVNAVDTPRIKKIKRIGCFREDRPRAIPSVEGRYRIIQDRHRARKRAIRKCALVALRLGYPIFSVRRQGLCATGPRAHVTYKMYGRSNRCRNGKGAKWANTVYFVSGRSSRRSPVKMKLPSSKQLDYPIMPGQSAQNKPITTDIAFLLDGFSYVGPLNFNREKAFAGSISRYVAMKNQNLRIGVATYGSRARLHVRFAQHCNLQQALETFNYVQFPDQAGRRVDRALKAALSYFFPGRVNHCFTSRYLVVVVSGRQTEQPTAILKGLQQLPLQYRRHGVRVYVVVVGNVGAVIREHLRRITFRNGNLYVVPSFRKLVTKVGAITWSIRRRMRRQQIYQQRRCIPGSHHKGRARPKNAKLIKRLSSSLKRQKSRKEIEI